MTFSVGFVMDPLSDLKITKDTSLALVEAAEQRGWTVWYMEQADLFIQDGVALARMRRIQIDLTQNPWFQLDNPIIRPLGELPVVFMRKDPPFDMEYIYTTYILELAEKAGTLVVNRPQSLRDANEKLFTSWFPECCPPSLISRDLVLLREFIQEQRDVIIKPLGGMGGFRIFRTQHNDVNLSVILETMTEKGREFTLVQRFIPEITEGDKRILLVDGEPIAHMLARIPLPGESRGNLAAGGQPKILPLGERERWICTQIGPTLREKGLLFVGIDVIGNYLTEINVTSPMGIRELTTATQLNIAEKVLDAIDSRFK